MPKLSPEMTNARRDEIIAACETLYERMGFKDLTLKEIAKYTSLSRPSIYNYFETKEEIFLAILQKEYWSWVEALNREMEENDTMTKDEVAQVISRTLCDHPQILKIVSMNHYDMEENSREERLCEFKVAYGKSLKAVDEMLKKFCTDMSEKAREEFIYCFFPFIYGIYPYTVVTDKQKIAMEQAEVGYVFYSIYELSYTCAKKLINA